MKYLVKFYDVIALISFISAFLCVLIEVIARNIFSFPTPWAEELTGMFGVWCIFFGAAGVWYRKNHITINMILERLNEKGKVLIIFPVNLLVLIFALAICYGSFEMMIRQSSMLTPSLEISIAWTYLALVLSACGMVIFQIKAIINSFNNLKKHLL